MFRGKDDKQQFHLSTDGGFWSAPRDKTVRMALIDQDSGQQQGGGSQPATQDTSGSGGSSGSGGQQQKGQSAIHQDNQQSKRFIDVTKDETRVSGTAARLYTNGNCYLSVSGSNCYVGGNGSDGAYSPVVTVNGPCTSTTGKYG
jgi:hypothetical protein